MKRFIFLFVFTIMSLVSFGQDLNKIINSSNINDAKNSWIYYISDGDELKGTIKTEIYTYANNDLSYMVEFRKNDNGLELYILSANGIFNYNQYDIIFGKCGIYDENNNLIENITGILNKNEFVYSTVDNSNHKILTIQNNFSSNKKFIQKRIVLINKIFNYLMNDKGYIRFIASKYNEPDMDIKIYCVNN